MPFPALYTGMKLQDGQAKINCIQIRRSGEANRIRSVAKFIGDSVKTLKLYAYSVYFSDGTEWGDKDATKSTILNNGAAFEVPGQS